VNTDLNSLARYVSVLDGQRPERLSEVHARIGVARKRRRRTAVGAAAAVTAAVALAAFATGTTDKRGSTPANQPDGGSLRQLAYAEGDTIHYGDKSIDVGEEVQFLAVTDDGVAFVREPASGQPGEKPLWFTDGSTVEKIGTTFGSPAGGYLVEASHTGSLLVVRDGGPEMGRAYFVVIDTSTGQVIHRNSAEYGGTFELLSVHDDAVYWVYPRDNPCKLAGERECFRYRRVLGYEVATDSFGLVSWARYDEKVRNRARTIVGPDPGTPPMPGTFPLDPVFERQGTDLIARDYDRVRELALTESHTGRPIHLRVPPEATEATRLEFSHWLDDDRLVLFAYTGSDGGTDAADEGDIFVCALSTGDCRLELQGQPGTAYQLPGLD
jgi:hypothetical protein